MPLMAIWNVLPLATTTGCPVNLPNEVRRPARPSSPSDTMDQLPPELSPHDSAVDGIDPSAPADEFVALPRIAWPPVTYPPPDAISVPDADAVEAVEVSFSLNA